MTAIRLVYVINHIEYGGAEIGMVRLLQGIDPDLFDIHVITLKHAHEELKSAIPEHVSIIEWGLPSGLSGAQVIKSLSTIRSADVLVTSLYPSIVVGSIIGAVLRVPTRFAWQHVATVVDWWKVPQERLAFRLSDGVLTDSEATADLVGEWGISEDRIHILPLSGVRCEKFPSVSHEQRTPLHVGSVGRLVEKKGYRELLECASRLSDLEFHIVGDGPQARELSDAPNNVTLHGRVSDERLRELWKQFDIYFQPSHLEGLCITAIEAMACQLPVVASDVDGLSESVVHEETGFLVPPRDIDGYVSRLSQLAQDAGLRTEMGERGRERVDRLYSQQALVSEFEQLIASEAG